MRKERREGEPLALKLPLLGEKSRVSLCLFSSLLLQLQLRPGKIQIHILEYKLQIQCNKLQKHTPKNKSTKLQIEIPGLLHHICVTEPSCQLCLSQTSPLQCLPLLVPLSLLRKKLPQLKNMCKTITSEKYEYKIRVNLLSGVVDCFLQRGDPLQSASVAVGLELVHLNSKCHT